MKTAGTYKITRQGQITLPSLVREELKLKEGQLLDFFYSDDTIVIRKKREPVEVFREIAAKATKRFSERRITKDGIKKEIEAVRRAKHAQSGS